MKAVRITPMLCLPFIAACATQPENVVATYVSPSNFASYNCKQIISERNMVVSKVNELTGAQEKKANNDAVAVGVAAVLFWPVAFMVASGSDNSAQLASMKGNYEALTAAGHAKGCF